MPPQWLSFTHVLQSYVNREHNTDSTLAFLRVTDVRLLLPLSNGMLDADRRGRTEPATRAVLLSESRPASREAHELFLYLVSNYVLQPNPVGGALPLNSCSANATISLDTIAFRGCETGKLSRQKGH